MIQDKLKNFWFEKRLSFFDITISSIFTGIILTILGILK